MADNENQFTFSGELKRIDTFETKGGKQILTLVFETGGQWSQTVPIKVFGRLVDEANDWTIGSLLMIHGRLGGREFNGRVYGESVATKVEVRRKAGRSQQTKAPTGAAPEKDMDDSSSVPF